jgi:hypothetical protein
VHKLLLELERLVQGIEEGAAVRAVLEQAVFFAARMGQVGCDFSASVVPLFTAIVVQRTVADWPQALASFRTMLQTERICLEVDDAPSSSSSSSSSSSAGAMREQVVPLYLSQEKAGGADSSLGGFGSPHKRSSDDVPAPVPVMSFPPLAFLLNSLLAGLNFLRECPLLSAREAVLSHLKTALVAAAELMPLLAKDIRTKGGKYLQGQGQGLDTMYARCLACELIPHVLACFDHIFTAPRPSSSSSSASGAGGKGQGRGKAVALRVNSLSEVGEALSADCVEALERCWKGIEAGGLLSLSLPLSPASSSSSSSSAAAAAQGPGQGLGSAVAAADEPSSS